MRFLPVDGHGATLEQMVQHIGFDSPVIGYRKLDGALFPLDLHHDMAIAPRVFDGVAEKIYQHLDDELSILSEEQDPLRQNKGEASNQPNPAIR